MERGDGSVLKFKGKFFQKIFSLENDQFQKKYKSYRSKLQDDISLHGISRDGSQRRMGDGHAGPEIRSF
jgi:hypothetical protein